MRFITILLALAAASPVFSAPVPSTELKQRHEPENAAVGPRHDTSVERGFLPPSKRQIPADDGVDGDSAGGYGGNPGPDDDSAGGYGGNPGPNDN